MCEIQNEGWIYENQTIVFGSKFKRDKSRFSATESNRSLVLTQQSFSVKGNTTEPTPTISPDGSGKKLSKIESELIEPETPEEFKKGQQDERITDSEDDVEDFEREDVRFIL